MNRHNEVAVAVALIALIGALVALRPQGCREPEPECPDDVREELSEITRSMEVPDVASWIVSGAGDNSYNGSYSEVGTHNGQPTYRLGASSRYLWYAENEIGGHI